mmetsp:Transcript_23139/g.42423  ORF Transcript_23139/g.42423 Transcript_23139/m.42423 type:complete len:210 (-) Transcript_23139:31-660(-)
MRFPRSSNFSIWACPRVSWLPPQLRRQHRYRERCACAYSVTSGAAKASKSRASKAGHRSGASVRVWPSRDGLTPGTQEPPSSSGTTSCGFRCSCIQCLRKRMTLHCGAGRASSKAWLTSSLLISRSSSDVTTAPRSPGGLSLAASMPCRRARQVRRLRDRLEPMGALAAAGASPLGASTGRGSGISQSSFSLGCTAERDGLALSSKSHG